MPVSLEYAGVAIAKVKTIELRRPGILGSLIRVGASLDGIVVSTAPERVELAACLAIVATNEGDWPVGFKLDCSYRIQVSMGTGCVAVRARTIPDS